MVKNTSSERPSRVVILGANGFVGRTLTSQLLQLGIDTQSVTSADFDFESAEAVPSLRNIVRKDDAVVMLAALTPGRGRDRKTFMRNLKMASNVCEALSDSEPAHVIYVSSDAVYAADVVDVAEQSCASPQDLYGMMHRSRETMFTDAFKESLCIVRPTIIFGNGDPHNSYGPNRLRRMAKADHCITLFGAGEETRDHIHVDDAAKLLIEILNNRSVGILNAATGRSISYDELANKIVRLFDTEIKVVHTDRANPITHRHFDVTEMHKAFPAFAPNDLDTALREVHTAMLEGADG